VALEHGPVGGADLVGQDDQRVADRDIIERDIAEGAPVFLVGDGGHALGERIEHGRSAADRVVLEGAAAREHEHDERACEVLFEDHGRDNRDAGEQVGAELEPGDMSRQFPQQRQAAERQGDVERDLCRFGHGPSQEQVDDDRYRCEDRDQPVPARQGFTEAPALNIHRKDPVGVGDDAGVILELRRLEHQCAR